MYQHGLRAAVLAKTSAEVQNCGYVIFEGPATSAEASESALQSSDYLGILPESSSGSVSVIHPLYIRRPEGAEGESEPDGMEPHRQCGC